MRVKMHEAPKPPTTARARNLKRVLVPTGIRGASIVLAPGDGVVMLVRWHDVFDIPESLCSIRMSPEEARQLGEKLLACK